MKIFLSGYGAMNKIVASLAEEKGMEIVGVFSLVKIENCKYNVYNDIRNIPKADVIIDFSHPNNAVDLLENAKYHRLPIVVATTGEREKLYKIMKDASIDVPIFFSSNMSYGIHILTKVIEYITPMLIDDFDIEILEKHHNKKIDAPSGTAIKLFESIKKADDSLMEIYNRTEKYEKRKNKEVGISVMRGGTIVGEHEIMYAGSDEIIEISHRALSKKIFAEGALIAAKKLVSKERGFYTFDNL